MFSDTQVLPTCWFGTAEGRDHVVVDLRVSISPVRCGLEGRVGTDERDVQSLTVQSAEEVERDLLSGLHEHAI